MARPSKPIVSAAEMLSVRNADLATEKAKVAKHLHSIMELEQKVKQLEGVKAEQEAEIARLKALPPREVPRERERLPDTRTGVGKRIQIGTRRERDFDREVRPVVEKALIHAGVTVPAAVEAVMSMARAGVFSKWEGNGVSALLHVGHYEDRRPAEIFLRADRSERGGLVGTLANQWSAAVSIGLQYGIPLEVFVNKMQYVRDETGGFTNDPEDRQASSLIDAIATWLRRKYMPRTQDETQPEAAPAAGEGDHP